MFKRRGQATLEYVVLIIIVIGAVMSIGNYFKRALQGRWKAAVDDVGDQYDPRFTNTAITHKLLSNAEVQVYSVPGSEGGIWTMRQDTTNSVETKTGFSRIGAD